METSNATVLLVDSLPIVRHGIASLIEGSKCFKVVGEAGSAAETLKAAERLQPRAILMDPFLDNVIELDLIQRILEKSGHAAILVFSMQADAAFAHRALRAGASGYLLKEEHPKQILLALRRVLEGKPYLSPPILKRMLYYYANADKNGGENRTCRLSERELQVFRLIGLGLNIRQIAVKLSLERKTVDTYCSRMKKKLHLGSLSELTREAIRWNPELHITNASRREIGK